MRGLRDELSQDIKVRLTDHKANFVKMFINRYKELLPNLIVYENTENTSIDFLKLEVALRNNYSVVVGKTAHDQIMIMGYTNTTKSSEDPSSFLFDVPMNKKDINFIIPGEWIPDEMEEISYLNNCATGDFVVIKNKVLNYNSDMSIVEFYTNELAELVLSRFSIAIQSKVHTFFTGNANDESINQLVNELYNGSPYVKMTKSFDPKDNIHTFVNEFMAGAFQELKREYQNKVSELNNMLGINSLAVEKSSGVSDTEAKSNASFTTSNANIYLSARNQPFDKLNRRFGTTINAIYNDKVESEFSDVAFSQESNEG